MTRTHLFFFAALAWGAAAFASSDSLDVKTGLWEITYTTETHGSLLPQSTLDKLTPEQRAKAEASMNAREASGPRSHTDKTCVTAEDLEKGAFREGDPEEGSCKHSSVTRTSTVQEETVQCAGAEGRRGTFKVEAQDRDHITAAFTQEGSGGGIAVHMTGKWLAASCPADLDD